jgi:hypothetical protein
MVWWSLAVDVVGGTARLLVIVFAGRVAKDWFRNLTCVFCVKLYGEMLSVQCVFYWTCMVWLIWLRMWLETWEHTNLGDARFVVCAQISVAGYIQYQSFLGKDSETSPFWWQGMRDEILVFIWALTVDTFF